MAPQAIRQTFESRPGPFLAVVITDGVLTNVRPAVAELRDVVGGGCDLALLHVGRSNEFTKAIRAMNRSVHIVEKVDDLVGLTLGLARKRYAHRQS